MPIALPYEYQYYKDPRSSWPMEVTVRWSVSGPTCKYMYMIVHVCNLIPRPCVATWPLFVGRYQRPNHRMQRSVNEKPQLRKGLFLGRSVDVSCCYLVLYRHYATGFTCCSWKLMKTAVPHYYLWQASTASFEIRFWFLSSCEWVVNTNILRLHVLAVTNTRTAGCQGQSGSLTTDVDMTSYCCIVRVPCCLSRRCARPWTYNVCPNIQTAIGTTEDRLPEMGEH